MTRLVGEAHNLVFNRRAVARTDAVDASRVNRTAVEVGTDDFVCGFVGIDNMAGCLRQRMIFRAVGTGRERFGAVFALLDFHAVKVDRGF